MIFCLVDSTRRLLSLLTETSINLANKVTTGRYQSDSDPFVESLTLVSFLVEGELWWIDQTSRGCREALLKIKLEGSSI